MAKQGVYRVEERNELLLLENDEWRYIPTEEALFSTGYGWGDVQVIDIATFCKYEIGAPVPAPGWPTYRGYLPHRDWYDAECAKTAPPPPTVYPCPHCVAVFGSQAELDTHIVDAHPPLPPPPPPSNGVPLPTGFLRIAWPCGFPGTTVADFKKYTDLGINCLMIYSHWWDEGFVNSTAYCKFLNDCFDAAAQAGVKMFMQVDNRTFVKDWKPFVPCISADQGKPFVTQFKDKPAVAGWLIADEPHCGRYYCDFDLKGNPAQHNPGAGRYYTGLTDAQIAEWWPYGLPQTRWIGHAGHKPYGGQIQGKMQYDLIRGQDPNMDHWTFSVWMHGFEFNCPGYGWLTRSIYYYCYTPGHEVGDIGAIDIYPGPADYINLDAALGVSYRFPNGDGFSQIGEGMIGVINAMSGNPTPKFLVAQYEAWKRVYGDKLRGIGFWTPGTWLADDARGAEYRRQIKVLGKLTGWVERTITTKALTHACGAKIEYQVSSIDSENVALACPYDGASLGVKGLSGRTVITNIDDMASNLQGEIATLNTRIAELQGEIETLEAQIAEAREIIGV